MAVKSRSVRSIAVEGSMSNLTPTDSHQGNANNNNNTASSTTNGKKKRQKFPQNVPADLCEGIDFDQFDAMVPRLCTVAWFARDQRTLRGKHMLSS